MNSPSQHKITQIISRYVPDTAQAYCVDLWLQYPFSLKITRGRLSKLGDYRYDMRRKTHRISVNGTLNPYAFLITYIHEVAHLLAFQTHGFQIAPHGREWKLSFQHLMKPMLHPSVFPDSILHPLTLYMRNPKAASGSDQKLSLALQHYNQPDGYVPLAEIAIAQAFRIRQRVMVKETIKRTRAVCRELESGKRYLVSQAARVEPIRE